MSVRSFAAVAFVLSAIATMIFFMDSHGTDVAGRRVGKFEWSPSTLKNTGINSARDLPRPLTQLTTKVSNDFVKMDIDESGAITTLIVLDSTIDVATGDAIFGLERLRNLSFAGCSLSPKSFSNASRCSGLKGLSLSRCTGLDDSILDDVGRAHQLQELSIFGAPHVSRNGIRHLRRLVQLRFLEVSEMAALTDEEMEAVASMPELERLYLNDVNVAGQGLVHLGRLSHLHTLVLRGLPITDTGVRQLSRLKGLRELHIGASAAGIGHWTISRSAVRLLQDELMGCRVVVVDGTR